MLVSQDGTEEKRHFFLQYTRGCRDNSAESGVLFGHVREKKAKAFASELAN